MIPIRVIAISTELVEQVRAENKDPHYGFPAYTDVGKESAPCRHCLRLIRAGEKAILFTFDAFEGIESLPLPGPVYIHADRCERYREDGGFPPALHGRRTLNAYGRGRRLVAQEYTGAGNADSKVETLFARGDVDYVHVRSTDAGCYTFRLERASRPESHRQEEH